VKSCLYGKTQMRHGTDTINGFEYAYRYMSDSDYQNVVSIFTKGNSDSGLNNDLKQAVQAIRRRGQLLAVGIGSEFNKELTYYRGY